MNKRIKELALQANPKNIFKEFDRDDIHFVEKFAELLAKECIAICEKDLCDRKDDPVSNYFDGGLRHCARSIKEHFGVEL